MKTITHTYNVYTIDELPPEAQEKAHQAWASNNDYYFLEDFLNERLHELLKEKDIIDTNDTSKAGTKPTAVIYSLSYCQGDGAMFEGNFIYTHKGKKYVITVKHSGHYYHYNSKNFYTHDEEGEGVEEWEEVEKAFDIDYVDICKQLECAGYDFIEYEDSMECFKEACEANEYTFTIEGVMDNSD